MAIEKKIDIIVDTSSAVSNVDKLDTSIKALDKTTESFESTQKQTKQAVLDNGGAMGLLNDATGGLAMTFKDAVEASSLFGKQSKIGIATQKAYTFVMGTSTGAMKAFKLALIGTGIGALVVGVGLLIANFDKVKKAVMNLIPGFEMIADFIGGIVEAITDFVGITSDLTRELDKMSEQATRTLDKNKLFLDAYGDQYDEFTKRKIEANNTYAEHVKTINENEELSEEEKLRRLKLLRERANREIVQADLDREAKRNEARQKELENERAEYKRKQDELKARRAQELKEFETFQEQFKKILYKYEREDDDRRKQRTQDQKDRLQASADFGTALLLNQNETNKRISAEEIELAELVKNTKINVAQQTIALLGEIAGEGSKVGKALAVAQATINGYQAVQNTFATASASPITTLFPAYPFIQAGLAGAFSALQIKKILATDPSKGGGSVSGGGSGGGQAPQAPSFNLVGGTGINQIAQGLGQQNQPIQAYVVSGNVTSAQALDRNIVNAASVG
jgi:hypothetical protein